MVAAGTRDPLNVDWLYETMSNYPIPGRHRRGVVRWLVLLLHTLIFAAFVFAYPELAARFPEYLTGNVPWLAIQVWAGVVLLHLLLVCLLEMGEAWRYARIERRQRRAFEEYQAQQKRDKMLDRV